MPSNIRRITDAYEHPRGVSHHRPFTRKRRPTQAERRSTRRRRQAAQRITRSRQK